jgi:lipopolysaccharide export system protein LptC
VFHQLTPEHTDVSGTALATDGDDVRSIGKRERAYSRAQRHSRRVRVLKIAIPAGAVAAVGLILFVVVLKPLGQLPGLTMGAFSLSGTKVAMENPRLTGFRDKDGRPYEVTATAAFQDIRRPSVIELKDMRAKVSMDGGGAFARLVSNAGLFDSAKEHLDLKDEVRITTDKGDEVVLRSASVNLKAGTMSSSDPVRITTPSGTVEAEGVQVSDGGHTITFTGRVRAQFFRSVSQLGGTAGDGGSSTPARLSQAEPGER